MAIAHDVPLAPRTTLGLGGPGRRWIRATSESELRDALAVAEPDEPVLVLGGGSNLVVRDGGFAGLVVEIAIDGIRFDEADDAVRVTAGAGVAWDELVARTVERGLVGLECLSGIPGRVGATPIQNVGAYGQEVAETITHVRVFDRQRGECREIANASCGFGYRTSRFRGDPRFVITRVQYLLPRGPASAPIHYAELARALGVTEGDRAMLADVRRTVIALRRGKGMVVDPSDPESRSAGSFFTNPVVDADHAHALVAAHPGMPTFVAPGGRRKLAAAWLIEQAGFARGTTRGGVGISRKHALALVHRGGGTTRELLALADEIRAAVRARFGVALELEPIVVGVD
jgi:UDP-N-acetylmuramate dehydrogenase